MDPRRNPPKSSRENSIIVLIFDVSRDPSVPKERCGIIIIIIVVAVNVVVAAAVISRNQSTHQVVHCRYGFAVGFADHRERTRLVPSRNHQVYPKARPQTLFGGSKGLPSFFEGGSLEAEMEPPWRLPFVEFGSKSSPSRDGGVFRDVDLDQAAAFLQRGRNEFRGIFVLWLGRTVVSPPMAPLPHTHPRRRSVAVHVCAWYTQLDIFRRSSNERRSRFFKKRN